VARRPDLPGEPRGTRNGAGVISWQARIVKLCCRVFVKQRMKKRDANSMQAILKLRRSLVRFEPYSRRITRGLGVRDVASPVPGEWLMPAGEPHDRAILYVHGGAFIAFSPLSHRRLTTALVRASGVPAFVVAYRLAPEYPFPAALDDVLAAFDALVARGIPPAGIVLAGDSAGGGLVLSAGLALTSRATGASSPGGIIAYSPWTDLLATGDSIRSNARSDDMLVGKHALESARNYAPTDDMLRDPLASPLYGNLTGFPPTLIFASESEILRDDAVRFAERARAAGARVELVLEPAMPHVWPIFFDVMPEAKRTIAHSAAFISMRLRDVRAPAAEETLPA
jgi:monoterpene epsilon-lactone hydrolase